MFEIGDYITGNCSKIYAYTDNNALMVVTDIKNDYTIKVKIIGHNCYRNQLGKEYPVDIDKFIKVDYKKFRTENYDWHYLDTEEFIADVIEAPVTAMDTSMTTIMSDEWKDNMVQQIGDLLDKYDYTWSYYGCDRILDVWHKNKQWIEYYLSKHPNWDDERKMIVLSNEYNRPVDPNMIEMAVKAIKCKWVSLTREAYINKNMLSESRTRDKGCYICFIDGFANYTDSKAIDGIVSHVIILFSYFSENVDFNDEDNVKEFNNSVKYIKSKIREEDPIILSEKFKAHKGERATKLFRRFCKELGIDKWVDKLPVRDTGRFKDYGFNNWYTKYTDAINPIAVTQYTLISINPIDYLTMSFGNTWGSCHTIDKTNKRGLQNTFSGCYSSGTLSYMLDGASIIMYTVKEEYDGKDYQLEPKIKRCMFHIGEDKIVQGRVYPDGRDGGDVGLSAQMRAVMQKIISDLFGYNNLWVLKKGTSENYKITDSHGTNYRDYTEYDDCTVSYVKHENGSKNKKVIHIGHNPICPDCGCEHREEEWIVCENCREECSCPRCGGIIRRDEGITTADGERYCCDGCAEDAGYVLCGDDEWHYRDDCIYDDYTEEYEYVSHWNREYIVTIEIDYNTYQFVSAEKAEEFGFRYCTDGEWHRESDCTETEDGDWIYDAT